MFPRPWYGATFYSSTYWPRPGVRIRDALLQDFLVIAGEARSTTVAADSTLVTVTAPIGATTVEALELILVEAPDRFVAVER